MFVMQIALLGGDTLAAAGFEVPRLSRWQRFVDSGELARTLTHTCLLVKPRVDLGYRLVLAAGALSLVISIDGDEHVVPIEAEPDAGGFEPLAAIFRAINAVVAARGEQLVLVEVRRSYRVVFVAPSRLPPDVGWYAELCVVDVAAPASDQPPAALAPLDAQLDQRFELDGSLPGLVAAYVLRMARFAGIEHAVCEPRWHQEPGELTLTLSETLPTGGGWSRTVSVPYMPELDVQPILDAINSSLEQSSRRLYRVARSPDRIEVALLDKVTAAELRRRGDLIEHPARDVLRALAGAGVELPALSSTWEHAMSWVGHCFGQLAILADGIVDLAVAVAKDEEVSIAWTIAGRTTTLAYPASLGSRPLVEVFPQMIGDLNRLLHEAGVAHRYVVMTGAPYFYAHRLLLLDPSWLAIVARYRQVRPECLDEATRASLVHPLGAYPSTAPASTPPRLPGIADLVARDRILGSDFKCSARPSDFPDLIEEIARFARIAVEIGADLVDEGEVVAVPVTHRGVTSIVRVDNAKYVNPTSILTYLNGLLATRTPRHQLYLYRAGGYAGGIVRATDDEAARLRRLGYIQ